MTRRLIKTVAVWAALVAFDANAWWEIRSSTPTAAQTTVDFEGKSRTVVGALLVNFMAKLDCKPEVSVVMIDGDRLGTPGKQGWAKSKMTIWVDGKKVWNERTAIMKYSNAIESGGAATPQLIEALKTGTEATVQPLGSQPKFVFGLENSTAAINEAHGNCR